jgi:hypothetical protein
MQDNLRAIDCRRLDAQRDCCSDDASNVGVAIVELKYGGWFMLCAGYEQGLS